MKIRINGHAHLLPYPEEIPAFMKEREIFWIDADRKCMRQKGWSRPITAPSFFLKEKIEWMDANNIHHAVVLNLSQLYGNGLPSDCLMDVLRFQNDYNAKIQHNHPQKFTCGFVVHAGYIDQALQEIERCVEELKLQVLCLPTHYLDQQGKWKGIFDPEIEPILELANRYQLAVEVHPYDGEKFIQLENTAWRFHVVWMLAQCADAYHFYTLNNYYVRYPNARVCFAHGGQLNQVNYGRRVQAFDGRPDLFVGMERPKLALGHPNIFFDTLVHDVYSLELLIKRQRTTNQIIMGLDDPYPLGEMESERQSSYPGKLLDLAVEAGVITPEQQCSIWYDNVLNWLTSNEQAKNQLINRIGIE